MNNEEKLEKAQKIIASGLDRKGAADILWLTGIGGHPVENLGELRLYSDFLPRVDDFGFTESQRFLHFLWDALDKSPVGLDAGFSIPFRRIVAKALFRKCGKNFIAEENVRFNFGQGIEVGDDVFLNRGVFLDSKGGITIGNSTGLAENVQVFTHSHSESDHTKRTYKKVTIGNFVVVYTASIILPGVCIGDEAIVAAGSIVTEDVEASMMVGGRPAGPIRERRAEGRHGRDLHHLWLKDGLFQGE
ncbi:MAG: Galactoside O-acetyltransferase [Syntrophorhabdus sp. PtaB.Bin047]|nr:MAG: Galactoside O-acetyltransferase [Syntrophorhabdus sp. PtaB.Bin047]